MSIFENEREEETNAIKIVRKKDQFYVVHNGWPYDLSPSPMTRLNMPPNMMGMDEVVRRACDIKNIRGDLRLELYPEWTPEADAKATFTRGLFDGWVYDISGESLDFKSQMVWVCPYLGMMMGKPPELMFLAVNPD